MGEIQRHIYQDVLLEGHLIDSNILSRIMGNVMELGGDFEFLTLDIGRQNTDPSRVRMRVFGKSADHMQQMLARLTSLGASPEDLQDAQLAPSPADGVFPENFYSTTNLVTAVHLEGQWRTVPNAEMDLGLRYNPATGEVRGVAISDARKGDLFVVGNQGLRVTQQERPREIADFEFMNSTASSEKPKAQVIRQVANILREVKAAGEAVVVVCGPAIVHTGASEDLARLVRGGYVSVLFGGNAVATHDVERALYGTSLGIDMQTGLPVPGGHEHHLRAINRIRLAGSLTAAVEQGVVREGLMHALVTNQVPFVLAGSIRDDGPLPDVITDAVAAQEAMRPWCQKAGACLMLSTMLHSIATGNMLPAAVTTVCVDINPAVVTKLSDRGSFQTIGIITDVGLFLKQLADELNC
ncbi:TIGR00300 family protein [Parvibacter caecicola]|uniref:ornithine cyclodeaminase n=1 Tax=Parvibacter caecicola TaxID=747645 RepID=UPI00248C188F|nr:TIGR00300 family protein [Parvibacter caecicola]